MVTFSRIQTKGATGNPPTATFDSTPIEGNLLVAVAFHRSSVNVDGATISGSGWTSRLIVNHNLGYHVERVGIRLWTKVAGASEPSGITTGLGTTNSLLIHEFSAGAGATWTFEAIAELFPATRAPLTTPRTETSGDTGTTASISAGDILEIPMLLMKNSAATGFEVIPANFSAPTIGNLANNGQLATVNGRSAWSGWLQSSAAGTRKATANWSWGTGEGSFQFCGIMLAFSAVGASSGLNIYVGGRKAAALYVKNRLAAKAYVKGISLAS